ncbi:hypothetical protein SRABI106_04782 [Rahnella aquatilis]|nr:hypothetical protein SRABI106_04782 [Rahnella aquatilis]
MVHHERNIFFLCRVQQAFGQLGGAFGQGLMYARLRDLRQAGNTGRHGNRVTGKRACLINRTGRCQRFHHVAASAKCAHRHAAADDFTQTGQVRHHIVILLSTAQCDAETGHHFVDDQQCAKFITNCAQTRQEFR